MSQTGGSGVEGLGASAAGGGGAAERADKAVEPGGVFEAVGAASVFEASFGPPNR